MLICCVVLLGPADVITGITRVVAAVGTTGHSCQEVYERGSTAVVPDGATEELANPGGGASASNSWSRDIVMAGEAGMVVTTELVTSNGLLVVIT
ncbi:hypothetical protein Hanom_Chr00s000005g01610961 [Helianthus anomalus]